MDVMLVSDVTQARWSLVAALGLDPADGLALEDGFARLVHPSHGLPSVVVLPLDGAREVDWLVRLAAADHVAVPVVGLTADVVLADQARAAGATDVVADVAGVHGVVAAMAPPPVAPERAASGPRITS